jgi:hypothetical protein
MGASLFDKNAGDPVPQVDPDDVKAVWKFHEDLARRHPGKQVGIGKGVLEHVCKADADIAAVAYRAGMLRMFIEFGDQSVRPWMDNGEPGDALFCAAAQTRMEWLGDEVRQSWPFDIDEFLGRVRGQIA